MPAKGDHPAGRFFSTRRPAVITPFYRAERGTNAAPGAAAVGPVLGSAPWPGLPPLGHPTINLDGRYRTTSRPPTAGLRPLRTDLLRILYRSSSDRRPGSRRSCGPPCGGLRPSGNVYLPGHPSCQPRHRPQTYVQKPPASRSTRAAAGDHQELSEVSQLDALAMLVFSGFAAAAPGEDQLAPKSRSFPLPRRADRRSSGCQLPSQI